MLELCIRNGRVLDGRGVPEMRADVGIMDGRIVAFGDLNGIPAARDIDASGRIVCPGFLDMHRHADTAVFRKDYGVCDLTQGITSIGNGNCGLSLPPMYGPHASETAAYLHPVIGDFDGIPADSIASYNAALKKIPLPVNAMMLAGGGTIRSTVAGFGKIRLEDEDFTRIHALLEKCLSEGAGGISLGLGYAPECFYTTEELIRALEPIRDTQTVLSVHVREEAMRLLPSIDEIISVAKELRVPLQISHLKASGRINWHHAAQDALRRIAKAKEDGLDVSCDVYAYTFGSTQLTAILPPEVLQGGPKAVAARLSDPSNRPALLDRLKNGRDFDNYSYLVGWDQIILSTIRDPDDAEYVGKTIAEAAGSRDPAAFTLDLLAKNECDITMIDFLTCEEDIADILRSPLSYVISDATFPTSGVLHPRIYGAFSNVIEEYVNRLHALTLTEAVHKMSMMPADRYHLKRKGRIAVGADADILVFDPMNVHVNATYLDPTHPSSGMDYVLVNGKVAIDDGVLTGIHGGTVLEGEQ